MTDFCAARLSQVLAVDGSIVRTVVLLVNLCILCVLAYAHGAGTHTVMRQAYFESCYRGLEDLLLLF